VKSESARTPKLVIWSMVKRGEMVDCEKCVCARRRLERSRDEISGMFPGWVGNLEGILGIYRRAKMIGLLIIVWYFIT